MLLLLMVLMVCAQELHASIELEGCFEGEGIEFEAGVTHTFEGFNVNQDCAVLCASKGYILSATREHVCHCTNVMPPKHYMLKAPHELRNIAGNRSPCSIKCSGVINKVRTVCMGDECCGGMYRGRDTYSLYAVGGVNVVEVIQNRIFLALWNDESRRKMTWLKPSVVITTNCHNDYIEREILHGSVKLDLPNGQYDLFRQVNTLAECKDKCLHDRNCRSLTYSVHNSVCSVNYRRSIEAKVILSDTDTILLDRNCTSNVEILPTSFQLDVIDQKLSISEDSASGNIEPLGDEDFEIDLTNSNNWDTLKRSVSVSHSSDIQLSTQTGFESTESSTDTRDSSSTTTQGSNQESTSGKSSTKSSTWNAGASVTATAGYKGLFVSASVSATISTNFNGEQSSTRSSSQSSGYSSSHSKTQGESRSETASRSNVYNQGYIRSSRNDLTQLYDYSMTVPALHKGSISFFLKTSPVIIKVRTLLNLNGYVQFKVDGVEHEVHVARLLPSEVRELATLSTITYKRNTIMGKVVMKDKDGQPAQLLNQNR